MSEKIRGFQWAMTYRGFEFYAAKRDENKWIARPNNFVIPSCLEITGTFEELMAKVDCYWGATV